MKLSFNVQRLLRFAALFVLATVAVRAQSPPTSSQPLSASSTASKSQDKQGTPTNSAADRKKSTNSSPTGTAAPSSTSTPAAARPTPAASSNEVVWVNTDSRIYHKPGTRYYGKTKHGKYMLEADAIKAGYRDAGKK